MAVWQRTIILLFFDVRKKVVAVEDNDLRIKQRCVESHHMSYLGSVKRRVKGCTENKQRLVEQQQRT